MAKDDTYAEHRAKHQRRLDDLQTELRRLTQCDAKALQRGVTGACLGHAIRAQLVNGDRVKITMAGATYELSWVSICMQEPVIPAAAQRLLQHIAPREVTCTEHWPPVVQPVPASAWGPCRHPGRAALGYWCDGTNCKHCGSKP